MLAYVDASVLCVRCVCQACARGQLPLGVIRKLSGTNCFGLCWRLLPFCRGILTVIDTGGKFLVVPEAIFVHPNTTVWSLSCGFSSA